MIKAALMAALAVLASACAAPQPRPWMDKSLSTEQRAAAAVAAMTQQEKLTLVLGFTDPQQLPKLPSGVVDPDIVRDVMAHQVPGSAGYVPGIPRLGIPAQWQTDASIGVRVENMPRIALPSSLATAASFDPNVTHAGGVMIAQEARHSGFNVFLAGGADLAREPRNGRNFEYAGEDPLLSATMVSGLINGIQSQHMVSTTKHYALNDQETQRFTVNAVISPAAMRQSDLLAFEMILDRASPGSVMCSYNLINTHWACENDYLLNTVLKHDWGFQGYVMSDWGAVHSTVPAANAGLDQMTGFSCCDQQQYFGAPLRAAIAAGQVSQARLDDMARRILWPLFAKGVVDDPQHVGPIDFNADAEVSRHAAEQSLVLLKNNGLLPLQNLHSIAVIGGHADLGVMAGAGSSNVTPVGGNALPNPPQYMTYIPSSPYRALQAALPQVQMSFDSGADVAAAARRAAQRDVAIVFVTQWNGENWDTPLELTDKQDALVAAVARANPRTIVVIESGGAVLMPWLNNVNAVLEAFYPGARGGEAIADILTGKVNPSGHLPITFPASNAQLAHPHIAGAGQPDNTRVDVNYDEGAAIGYKWYDRMHYTPLFAFGHGLSYTSFQLSSLSVAIANDRVSVSVTVANIGARAGAATPQIYLSAAPAAGWEAPKRLVGFSKVMLAPGESRAVQVEIDPRLLATYREGDNSWIIAAGAYRVLAGQASDDLPLSAPITLESRVFSAVHASPPSHVQ
ncbi:MAG: glycoside hydrolase family 3 C-terminal domain-containing protein [Pseudomonadota bacterium]